MSNAGDTLVRFIDVQKSYDGKSLVVKNLNLDIQRGEFLTLLGPSGSGKTTCLMMLAGFEPPTDGEITLDGRSLNNVPPHKRGIGMVFQDYALFPHMSVIENLAYPLKVRKKDKAEIQKRTTQALEMVRLTGFENRRPSELSGGQQQRVAVARALVFDPVLVLMDEPLGALDKQLREQMQYEIKHIHENIGVTVVYVTHDQAEALTMSTRVAVLDDGLIQQLATPSDLYERPANAFVAQFIGENNRLMGEVTAIDEDQCRVELADGTTILALKVNVHKVGARTTLSLRPERVEIGPDKGSMPNMLEARIEELIYHGDHIRARALVCGHDFIFKIPNSAHHQTVRVGETIRIGWYTEDCRALDG